jgi:hypothetical protein
MRFSEMRTISENGGGSSKIFNRLFAANRFIASELAIKAIL